MASAGAIYRNYTSTDTTSQNLTSNPLPQPPTSWGREGYFFKEWNTSRDGSGTSCQPGDNIPPAGVVYAIWYGDYIEAIKDSSGIEHPIKDIISNYITSANVPIVVVEGEINNNGLTLPNNTFSDIYNSASSGKTIIIRNSIPGYGIYQYLLLSTATYYQNTYTLSLNMFVKDGESPAKAEFVATSTSGSDIPIFTPTAVSLQEKLTFDGTYNASTNKAATVSTVTNAINALDGGTIGTGSTTKTITSLSQTNGNVSATFSNIAFPVTSVNGQTGAVTTAEKFVITATAISGTDYYNLDKTFADINVAIGDNKYVTIEDIDMTYPYTTTVSQGVVFGATLIATGEGNQLLAITDGILVVPPDSGTNAMGIAVHSSTVLPTTSDIPSPSNTTPLMDGTAAVGTGTTWARADHVHPTDTSRQATLVSGTNIKTINNESILGSGNISISGGTSSIILEGTYTTPSNLYVQKTPTELYNYLGAGTVVYIQGIYDDEDPYFRQRTNSLYRLNSVEIQGEGNNSFYKASITSHLNVIGDNDTTIVYGYASGQTSDTSVAFTLMPIETDSANATNSTSKLFLVGATSQTASPSTYSNSNVYATNGVLNATSFSINESANIVYNSSSKSIDFTFV